VCVCSVAAVPSRSAFLLTFLRLQADAAARPANPSPAPLTANEEEPAEAKQRDEAKQELEGASKDELLALVRALQADQIQVSLSPSLSLSLPLYLSASVALCSSMHTTYLSANRRWLN
jgi:hypothetical protein